MSEYTLGQPVIYTATLTRHGVGGGNKHWHRFDCEPRHGLYIGARTLSNGWTDYDRDEGFSYHPKDYFRAALVVFSPNCRPVFVPMDALTLAGVRDD